MNTSEKPANLNTLIEIVMLRTGLSKHIVKEVIDCFVDAMQDAICKGRLRIKLLGLFECVIRTKPYFDINTEAMTKTTKPYILLHPSLRLIWRATRLRQKEIDEAKKREQQNDS